MDKHYLQEFKKFSKKINSSKKRANKFLIDAGIITKNGKLTKKYLPN
jgi:beta-N-acetylglucosaminidase